MDPTKQDLKAIDLHMHTVVSDGTDTPAEILQNVKAAGIGLFSVTDHDALKACRIIQALLQPGDPVFLPGVEFSCRDEQGKYHILGYAYDPESRPIQAVIAAGHGFRMNKLRGRIDFLKQHFGFEFPQDELSALFALDNPGKPHLANLMVKYGFAPTKEAAIRDYIDKYYARSQYVRPEEAIAGIVGSGGIPVLAHPTYGSGGQLILGDEMDQRIRRLMDFGLKGVEAFYSGFPAKIRTEILGFARQYGLYITAGSDYHGKNKIVRLGDTGLDEVDTLPEGLQRFLADVCG